MDQAGGGKFTENHFAALFHHFWNIVHHFYLTIFYRPVAYLPLFGFQIGGLTRTWNINAIELWIFWVWIFYMVFLSIVYIFYVRLKMVYKMIVLNRYKTLVNYSGLAWYLSIFITLSCGSSILLVFLSTPFVVQIKENAIRKYNNNIIFCPDFAIVDLSMWQTILPNALSAIGILILFLLMIFMMVVSVLVLNTSTKLSSQKTLNTQRSLMQHFIMQVSSHGIFLFSPLAVCFILHFLDRLNNVSIYTAIFFLAHQGVLTIIIFTIVSPIPSASAAYRSLKSIYLFVRTFGKMNPKSTTTPVLVRTKTNSLSRRSDHI